MPISKKSLSDFDRMAFDHAPIGIVLTEQRVIRSCNQTFADLLNYERSELIGQSFRMLYSTPEEFERIRDIGIEKLMQEGVYTDERMVTRRGGEQVWCRFRAQTLTRERPLDRTVMSYAKIFDKATGVRLSAREREVISYLSSGLISKEIARKLELSPRTVEDIRQRLLKKFNMRNTTELLAHLTSIEPRLDDQ